MGPLEGPQLAGWVSSPIAASEQSSSKSLVLAARHLSGNRYGRFGSFAVRGQRQHRGQLQSLWRSMLPSACTGSLPSHRQVLAFAQDSLGLALNQVDAPPRMAQNHPIRLSTCTIRSHAGNAQASMCEQFLPRTACSNRRDVLTWEQKTPSKTRFWRAESSTLSRVGQ